MTCILQSKLNIACISLGHVFEEEPATKRVRTQEDTADPASGSGGSASSSTQPPPAPAAPSSTSLPLPPPPPPAPEGSSTYGTAGGSMAAAAAAGSRRRQAAQRRQGGAQHRRAAVHSSARSDRALPVVFRAKIVHKVLKSTGAYGSGLPVHKQCVDRVVVGCVLCYW